jgi:hypothetical protein
MRSVLKLILNYFLSDFGFNNINCFIFVIYVFNID